MKSTAVIVPIIPAIKLKRILYATDFSQGSKMALPVVNAIARRYNSEVLMTHICPSHHYPLITPEAVVTLDQRREREAAKELAELVRDNSILQIPTTSILKTGEPVAELEQIVRAQAVDLAVLSTHGRVGVKRLLMGSVAEALLRRLTCPVLTVGPQFANRFRGEIAIQNILFPSDLSEESQAVFPYLASLAHEYKGKITLLHVLPPETENNPEAKRLAEPLRRRMELIFGPEISPECETEFVTVSGDPAERILEAARDADVIGFGIRKASEMSTHFRNTVSYRVLTNASCPVLTCRYRPQW
jgi:nucleotide-binding universal stress UspA family protein